jgi:hypothetical protein
MAGNMTPKYFLGNIPAVKMYISCYITAFALEVAVGSLMLDKTDPDSISQTPVRERLQELLKSLGPPDADNPKNPWVLLWAKIGKADVSKNATAVAKGLFPGFYEQRKIKWLLFA